MRAVFATVVTALAAVSLSGCGGDSTTTSTPCQNIVELASGNPDLSTLATLLTQQNLTGVLSGDGHFTVFAPTNAAFTAASSVTAGLSSDQLTSVLTYHVHSGDADVTAADLTVNMVIDTLFATHNLDVQAITPSVLIKSETDNTATVTNADVMACNGIVHVVDAVLVPTLAAVTTTAAPATTTPATTTVAPASTTAAPATTTAAPGSLNIVELASGNPDLSTLATLLTQQGLTDTLSGEGHFTVFAPTNAAFTAASSVTAGLSSDQLTSVLTYHVHSGDADVTAADLTVNMAIDTLFATHNLDVQAITPSVLIKSETDNTATVTTADVLASNGIVHIVDAVLVPTLPSVQIV